MVPSRVAVYTAVTAGYDALSIPPHVEDVDFIAFTDNPADAANRGWEPKALPDPVGSMSPRMRAKRPKLLPHVVLPDYPATIWVDASHGFKGKTFVDEMMAFVDPSGFALHKHPWRDCIYDELVASEALMKYFREPMRAQVESYRQEGHPKHAGLWACGSMVRLAGNPEVDDAMNAWWAECEKWSYQDQLSLPVVLRDRGWKPQTFPHHQVFDNPWFVIRSHPRNDE